MSYNYNKTQYKEVIGVLPAGGQATRIAPLPCSKEIYPVGFRKIDEDGSLRPKVVSHYLLEKMKLAGINKVYIVLRNGKWDIPTYYGDGKIVNMHMAYLILSMSSGVPYTIDYAYPFVKDAMVVLGFPDILFQPDDAFIKLFERQVDTNANIVLGLFPIEKSQKWDMVDFDDNGRIRQIIIKPPQTNLCYTWAIAVWTPVFTRFMHEYLSNIQNENNFSRFDSNSEQRELLVGDVIQAAIENNLIVEGVLFSDNTCFDIGTPEDLLKVFLDNK